MKYRLLGRTGWRVSEVSFGAWAIGSDWGQVSFDEAMATLNQAVDEGINFFDTADVYGDGRSEQLLARLKQQRPSDEIVIATKIGRRLNPHTATGYTRENLTAYVDRSLKNLGTETLDLVQLHCPPNEVYYTPEVFDILDRLVRQGKIRHYGVSVEKVEQAMKAIEYPHVETVQIIFNMFRQRPSETFFRHALRREVGVIARVPLASGLLTGKYDTDSTFPEDDHRNYNRKGDAFDVGETFSGIKLAEGVTALKTLKRVQPTDMSMAQFALRWALMFEAVSCVIPGGKRPSQVTENAQASELPLLDDKKMKHVRTIYNAKIRPLVHHRW